MDFVEQGRSFLLAQGMTRCVIHLFVACPSVDGKQFIHQLHDADRGGVQFVELDRVNKLPPRVAPTCSMQHLRSAHAIDVRGISVGL